MSEQQENSQTEQNSSAAAAVEGLAIEAARQEAEKV